MDKLTTTFMCRRLEAIVRPDIICKEVCVKKLIQLLAVVALATVGASEASALGTITLTGKMAGPANAWVKDLDGDGSPARTFDLQAFDSLVVQSLDGVVDATFAVPTGICAAGVYELVATGKVVFRGARGAVLYGTVDSSQHLCYDPTNATPEVVKVTITGGAGGLFAGKTGTATVQLSDVVVMTDPVTGFPLIVDSHGEFSITIPL